MSTIIPMNQMPIDEVHGAQISRSITHMVFYSSGHVDTQHIKESDAPIDYPDLADIPSHKKWGDVVGRTRHASAMFADQWIVEHTVIEHVNILECCSGGGCNPVYEFCG